MSLHLFSWREIEIERKARILKGSGIWFFNNTQIIRAFECTGLWPRLDNRAFKPTLLSESYQFNLTSLAAVQRCHATLVNAAVTRDNPCVSHEQIKKSMRLLFTSTVSEQERRSLLCYKQQRQDQSKKNAMLSLSVTRPELKQSPWGPFIWVNKEVNEVPWRKAHFMCPYGVELVHVASSAHSHIQFFLVPSEEQ